MRFLLLFFLLFFYAGIASAQWEPIHSAGGNTLLGFASYHNNLFAATNAGIIVSSDNGVSWNNFEQGLLYSEATAISVFDTTLLTSTYGGIAKFDWTDSIWVPAAGGGLINSFSQLGPFLFATGESGVLGSEDNGNTWNSLNDTFSSYCSIAQSTVLYAGTSDGIYISLDFGSTWEPSGDSSLRNLTVYSMASLNGEIYACGINQNEDTSALYCSTDGGSSWKMIFTDSTDIFVNLFINGSDIYATSLTAIYCSSDHGSTWTNVSGDIPVSDLGGLMVNQGVFIAGTQRDGLYRSTDHGLHWESSNFALDMIGLLSLYSGNNILFATEKAYHQGLVRSIDQGTIWSNIPFDTTSHAIDGITYIDSTFLLAASDANVGSETLYRSTNGEVWDSAIELPTAFYGNHLCFAAVDSNIYVGTVGAGLFLSTDEGKTWNLQSRYIEGSPDVYNIAAIHTTLLLSSDYAIYRADSLGGDWYELYNNHFAEGVNTLFAVGDALFAGTYDGMFRSTDRGDTWIQLDSTFDDGLGAYSFAAIGNNLFAGLGAGIYLSTDRGVSWSSVTGSLYNTYSLPSPVLTIDSSYLYATLSGEDSTGATIVSIWRRPLSEMIPVDAVAEPSVTVPILQNYPNPFSRSTTISITLPENGYTEISVVNLLGQSIAAVYSGDLNAGTHSFEWNPSGISDGVYECLVQTGNKVQTIPIVLARQ